MDKTRLIGGIVCLVIAAGLGALYFALPRDELMFMVGDSDIYLPPILLAAAGILLLISARQRSTR